MTEAEQAIKTRNLQDQFDWPIWAVWFGNEYHLYSTQYHAKQMVRALQMNGTPVSAFNGRGEPIAVAGLPGFIV